MFFCSPSSLCEQLRESGFATVDHARKLVELCCGRLQLCCGLQINQHQMIDADCIRHITIAAFIIEPLHPLHVSTQDGGASAPTGTRQDNQASDLLLLRWTCQFWHWPRSAQHFALEAAMA